MIHTFGLIVQSLLLVSHEYIKRYSGDYSTKVPPLPIPNREVKLRHADGTADCGRVGSRRFSQNPRSGQRPGDFFCLYTSDRLVCFCSSLDRLPFRLPFFITILCSLCCLEGICSLRECLSLAIGYIPCHWHIGLLCFFFFSFCFRKLNHESGQGSYSLTFFVLILFFCS